MEQPTARARSRDKIGRAFLLCLLAWARYGPDRPITGAERRALTGGIAADLTDEEYRGGETWAAGITGRPEVSGGGALAVAADLAARVTQILGEAGDDLDVPPPMLLAMIGAVNADDAEQIAIAAHGEGLLGIAAAAFEKAAGAADPVLALRNAGNLCETLNSSGRTDAAIEAADSAIARHPAPGPEADAALANLLYNRAVAIRTRQERRDQANPGGHSGTAPGAAPGTAPGDGSVAADFEAVAARFLDSDNMKARELAARAQLNATAAYLKAGDAENGLRASDAFMNSFDADGICPWSDAIASVMANRAQALAFLGRHREAAEECDRIYGRFSAAPGLEFDKAIARTGLIQGRALGRLGERDAAISAFGRSSRFAERGGELGQIAQQAAAESRVLEIEGLEEDLAGYDEFLARPAGASGGTTGTSGDPADPQDPQDRLIRAAYRVNRGVVLAALDRPAEAIAAYQELIGEIGDDKDPRLRVQLAMAMVNCGNGYRAIGRADAALRLYREVEAEFGDSAEPGAQVRAAQAALNQAGIYEGQGEAQRAAAQFELASERYGKSPATDVRDIALSALWNVVVLRLRDRDLDGVTGVLPRIIERFGGDASEKIRRRVLASVISAASGIDEQGHRAIALGTLAALASFLGDADAEVRRLAGLAQELRLDMGRER